MPRTARLAVLFSFIVHGVLILAARYRLSYDAYVHMFFGDHYRMDWWSLWDARWYTGFYVTSYPPQVHQLIGALSHIVGIDAFAVILWMIVTLLPWRCIPFTHLCRKAASVMLRWGQPSCRLFISPRTSSVNCPPWLPR
jgi:hypothetical protein